jgi:hypothetical protein
MPKTSGTDGYLKQSNTRLCRVSSRRLPTAVLLHAPHPPPSRFFFYQFCDVAKMLIIYIYKEDLAKYGYKLDMENKIIISIFL